MTPEERVLAATEFKPVDRLPMDLNGMNSTGISAFAYPALVESLGLPPRPPRIHDTNQMLALPEMDVLDALGCDVVSVHGAECTSAFEEPEHWHPYDFGGRLPARVMRPSNFSVDSDGTVRQSGDRLMVPGSYDFDAPHGGQGVDLSGDPPKEDLDRIRENLSRQRFTPERIAEVADYCRRTREATDKAIMFSGLSVGLGMRGGLAEFSMVCMLHPEHVHEIHKLLVEHCIMQCEALLPAIAPYVDILMFSADDQGTQHATILPPHLFGELYAPYYRQANAAVHRIAPRMKTFLHSCGAIYEILDDIIAAGFDIVNPVQWTAGAQGCRAWKDKCRHRIALWGGGVDTQHTLPLGSVADVEAQVREVVPCLAADSGFVFCAIHNLLAEIDPEKILAIYRTAQTTAGRTD